MSDAPFSEFCIYTIANQARLVAVGSKRGKGSFREGKPWVTGRRLFSEAQRQQLRMPVLFGDATDCRRLCHWGILTSIRIGPDGTRYAVEDLRQFTRRRSPQELTLRSTGERIAAGFIRPYAICRTPQFL